MAELSEFNTAQNFILEDFEIEHKPMSVVNTVSAANMAGHAAAIGTSESPIITYNTIKSELAEVGSSVTLENIVKDFEEKRFTSAANGVGDILADPNKSDEEKRKVIRAWENGFFGGASMADKVSETALITGPSGVVSQEMDIRDLNMSQQYHKVNRINSEIQKMVNGFALRNSSSSWGKVLDFAELLIPFGEGKQMGQILGDLREAQGTERDWATLKGLGLLGETKAEIVDRVNSMTAEDRLTFATKLLAIVKDNDSIVLPGTNDFSAINILQMATGAEAYTDTDRYIDNIVGILDVAGVTALLRRGVVKAFGKRKPPLEFEDLGQDDLDNVFGPLPGSGGRGGEGVIIDIDPVDANRTVSKRAVTTDVKPATLSQNYARTNTDKARAAHELAIVDDEAAATLYGTSRSQVVAHDMGPEVAQANGGVKDKIVRPGHISSLRATPDPEIKEFANNTGATYLWDEEKERARSVVIQNFGDAYGIMARENMTTIGKALDDGVNIKVTYSSPKGGWSNPREAMEHVKLGLRDYGIAEENLTLMVNRNGEYVPTTLEEVEGLANTREALINTGGDVSVLPDGPIDYIVGVDYNHKFNPTDVGADYHRLSVRNNVFSGFSPFINERGAGSLQQWLLDKDSMFDPRITGSFNALEDQSAKLEKLLVDRGVKFAKPYSKLPKERRAVIENIIKKANERSKNYTEVELSAMGVNESERAILKEWTQAWDNHYWLENRDLSKTLNARGVMLATNSQSESRILGTPIRNPGSPTKALDLETGEFIQMNVEDLRELYKPISDDPSAPRGTLMKLTTPYVKDGELVEFARAENKVGGTFLRRMNENDQVLTYREGYYTVNYKDPIFIEETITLKNGDKSVSVVATGRNIKDANHMIGRLEAARPDDLDRVYSARHTKKGTPEFREARWQSNVASGRVAQKIRGQRLHSTTAKIQEVAQGHIMDPVESLTNASRSISERTMTRDIITNMKSKFVRQFADMLPTKFGEPAYPPSIMDIKQPDIRKGSKSLRDARDLWEYINTMENGYVNSLDDAIKAGMNTIADMLGRKELTIPEDAVRAIAEKSFTSGAKGVTFNLFLASAPVRQFFLQGHQSIQLIPMFPKYSLTKLVPQSMGLFQAMSLGKKSVLDVELKAMGLTRKEFDTLVDQFDDTGLWIAPDKHNFVRENLKPLADVSLAQKTKSVLTSPLKAAQMVGFDSGERIAQMTSWLAHRNAAMEAGQDMSSKSVATLVQGRARSFTYSMNRAGDFPYNNNSFGAIMQFQQVAHKALLQMTFNRNLSRFEKGKMAAWNAVMYGAPSIAIPYLIALDPDNTEYVDAIQFGLETTILNHSLSTALGETQRVDWSGLAPSNLAGIYNIMDIMMSDSLMSAAMQSPIGSLFGGQGKVAEIFRVATRLLNLQDDFTEPTTFRDLAYESMGLFSGLSNGFKAAYALETGKKWNALGGITDNDVTWFEAIAQFGGFKTLDESKVNAILELNFGNNYGGSEGFKQDVKDWYKSYKKHLFRRGITQAETEHAIRTFTEARRVFDTFNKSGAIEIIDQIRAQDAKDGDLRLYDLVMRLTKQDKTRVEIEHNISLLRKEEHRNVLFQVVKDIFGED